MTKKFKLGVNTFIKKTRPSVGRHKKKMSKSERRSWKPYRGQGRA